MKVRCITSPNGFSLLIATVEVFSKHMEPFSVNAVVDTGASCCLLSPALVEILRPELGVSKMNVRGLSGETERKMFRFGVKVGDYYSRADHIGLDLGEKFVSYDMVLGLDVVLATGLTITPHGDHKLDA